jgi:hypothetical protein
VSRKGAINQRSDTSTARFAAGLLRLATARFAHRYRELDSIQPQRGTDLGIERDQALQHQRSDPGLAKDTMSEVLRGGSCRMRCCS